ncbi:MAG: hypothetical protein ACP5NG_00160 [Conexivisphaera sp.]
MRGWWALALVIVVAAAALATVAVHQSSARPTVVSPETNARPGYAATYNYTVSLYAGQLPLGSYTNEFRIRVASVDGDLVKFYYEPLAPGAARGGRTTLNYTYALVPSNLTTYYYGFGMPLFVSSSAAPGSGGANATLNGYNATYKYVVTRSDGYVLISSTIEIYRGADLVSVQYWYYQYNASTGFLNYSVGVLVTPTLDYRFEYRMLSFGEEG